MDYEQFLATVQQRAAIPRDQAERAIQATMETLSERLNREESRKLGAELPPELLRWVFTMQPAERLDVDELLRRVADREAVDLPTAERHVRAVFVAVRRSVGPEALARLRATLPQDFDLVLSVGPILSTRELLRRVADRAGVDEEGAKRAVDAVSETLAERIAAGEVDDLLARLPVELHAPLQRGKARAGDATRMRVEEFEQRIAQREGTTPDEAVEHARAVFAALREELGEEFFDVTVQLPPEYGVLFATRHG